MEKNFNDSLFDCEVDLIYAAIKEAAKEYIHAYKVKDYSRCDALERWFKSPEFETWTMGKVDPEYILKNIRREVDENGNLIVDRIRYGGAKDKTYENRRYKNKL